MPEAAPQTPPATEPNPLIEKPAVPVAEAKPPEPEKPPEKPKESAAQRFAAAAKAARKAQEERAVLKAEREKLEADRKALEASRLRPTEYLRNPLRVLADAFPGVEPSKAFKMLADSVMNDGKPTADFGVQEVRSELGGLKSLVEGIVKSQEEKEEKAREAARQKAESEFRGEVDKFIKDNADTYEYTSLYGQSGLVFETIREHFEQTGEEMDAKTAAEKVEKYLEGEVEKVTKAKKFAAKLKPPAEAAPTLGNAPPSPGPSKPLTWEEREKRAAAFLAQKLGA